jgi:hypothetical protein
MDLSIVVANCLTRVIDVRVQAAGVLVHVNEFRSVDFFRRIGFFTGIDVLLRETVGASVRYGKAGAWRGGLEARL